MKTTKWIQKAHIKKGALHKQLGYSTGKHIPKGILGKLKEAHLGTHVKVLGKSVTVTPLLKKRAIFAYNIRK
mgnify:CR=1 FL=1